jgi:hypothetical protein
MRELKEAAIKKIFAKESLEMKIISMQISTTSWMKITTLSSWRPNSRSRLKLRMKPFLQESTLTKL